MFTRPSARRKSRIQDVRINLIPMLDTLVTLISFLLFTTAFLALVAIDTPTPLIASAEEQIEKLKEKPLQLTAYIQKDQILISDWTGSRESFAIPNIQNPTTGKSSYDVDKVHQILLQIKTRHPQDKKLILKPEGGVSYETLIEIIDAARVFEKTDPPFYQKNEEGVDAPVTNLFPEVIFGNIMS